MADSMTRDVERGAGHPTDRTGFLFLLITNLWQRELKKALAGFDLTPTQFLLLESTYRLSRQREETTQISLSEYSKTDPMTTSQVLRTLQAKGLIQRREHPADTRAKFVELTELGKTVCRKASKRVSAFDEQFFSLLGPQTNELDKQLLFLLDRPG